MVLIGDCWRYRVYVCVWLRVLQTAAWSRHWHQPPDSAGNLSAWGGHVWQNGSCRSAFVGQFWTVIFDSLSVHVCAVSLLSLLSIFGLVVRSGHSSKTLRRPIKSVRNHSWRHLINQSINHLFAHNTSSNEALWTSRRDEQDSQAPGALMAALIKHTKI